jgi:hypothetical protein
VGVEEWIVETGVGYITVYDSDGGGMGWYTVRSARCTVFDVLCNVYCILWTESCARARHLFLLTVKGGCDFLSSVGGSCTVNCELYWGQEFGLDCLRRKAIQNCCGLQGSTTYYVPSVYDVTNRD